VNESKQSFVRKNFRDAIRARSDCLDDVVPFFIADAQSVVTSRGDAQQQVVVTLGHGEPRFSYKSRVVCACNSSKMHRCGFLPSADSACRCRSLCSTEPGGRAYLPWENPPS